MGLFLLCVGMVTFMVAIMLIFKPKSHEPLPKSRPRQAVAAQVATKAAPRAVSGRPVRQDTGHLIEQKLLAALHDSARVERLVAAKARKMGRASRQELLEAVYDDLLRDRR